MKVISSLFQKERTNLQPGEVFWVKAGGADVLGLYVALQDDGRHAWVEFPQKPQSSLKLHQTAMTGWCLAYNAHAVIEFVDGSETRPSNAKTEAIAMIDQTDCVFRVTVTDQHGLTEQEYLNIENMFVGHHIGWDPIPVANWNIWANEDHIGDPNRKPIYSYPPSAATQSVE